MLTHSNSSLFVHTRVCRPSEGAGIIGRADVSETGTRVRDLRDGMLEDDRREELHRAWVDFFETNYRSEGEIRYAREWLLITGTRR